MKKILALIMSLIMIFSTFSVCMVSANAAAAAPAAVSTQEVDLENDFSLMFKNVFRGILNNLMERFGIRSGFYVTDIDINKSKVTVNVGEATHLKATLEPEKVKNETISWISEKPSIAHVNNQGIITGRDAGTTKIYAIAADGGFYDSCIVTVTNKTIPCSKISVNNKKVSVLLDKTIDIEVSVMPSDTTDTIKVSKTSNSFFDVKLNKNKITVTGKKIGSDYITVTCGKQSLIIEVRVTDPENVTFAFDPAFIYFYQCNSRPADYNEVEEHEIFERWDSDYVPFYKWTIGVDGDGTNIDYDKAESQKAMDSLVIGNKEELVHYSANGCESHENGYTYCPGHQIEVYLQGDFNSEEYGVPENDFVWYVENDTLYINGTGDMPAMDAPTKYPWSVLNCYGTYVTIENIVIGEGVTSLPSNFSDLKIFSCGSMYNITIPFTVVKINSNAFSQLSSNLSNNVTVHYNGSEKQWSEIDIALEGNECLTSYYSLQTYNDIKIQNITYANSADEIALPTKPITSDAPDGLTFVGWKDETGKIHNPGATVTIESLFIYEDNDSSEIINTNPSFTEVFA